MNLKRFVFRLPSRERQPSSVSYSPEPARISGFSMATTIGPLAMAIMRFLIPIILAAMPTHRSRLALSVSVRSTATWRSAAVAGTDFRARKTGSCTIGRITWEAPSIQAAMWEACLMMVVSTCAGLFPASGKEETGNKRNQNVGCSINNFIL